jgi:hypothetical protein
MMSLLWTTLQDSFDGLRDRLLFCLIGVVKIKLFNISHGFTQKIVFIFFASMLFEIDRFDKLLRGILQTLIKIRLKYLSGY